MNPYKDLKNVKKNDLIDQGEGKKHGTQNKVLFDNGLILMMVTAMYYTLEDFELAILAFHIDVMKLKEGILSTNSPKCMVYCAKLFNSMICVY